MAITRRLTLDPPLSYTVSGRRVCAIVSPRRLADTRRASSHHGPTGEFGLSEIIIHEDENFERALKRFKKKVEKAGILSDLRKHRHYEKPSEKRKRKLNAAIRKNRRTRV